VTGPRTALPIAALGILTIAFAVICIRFVWQPTLASFADDSVSYLVMAQVLSPWHAASAPIAEAFAREAFYPPLFPLLLAVAGAAHDMALAHVVAVAPLVLCLPLLYLLAVRWLGSRWAAAAVAATAMLLPSVWINAKGILSEPLFLMLLIATLIVVDRHGSGRERAWLLALLMSALVLTRTVGVVVVMAYGLWALLASGRSFPLRLREMAPVLAALGTYAVWMLVRPAETSDDYMRIVLERMQLILASGDPLGAFAASVGRQAVSIWEGWLGSLLLFWVEGKPARVMLAGAVGLLALAGLALRLLSGKADAWLVGAYLATFLLWPFYDQMTRFLFPVLPVLVLYAFYAAAATAEALGRGAAPAHALLALLLVSVTVPGLAFIYQRANTGGPYALITDWYRTPDLNEARRRAGVQLALMADMGAIRERTPPGARVMWYVPSYLALLAERRGVPTPAAELTADEYRTAAEQANADYLFLSAYHPRDTIRDTAWRAGIAAMGNGAEVVHMRGGPDLKDVSALLIKLRPAMAVTAR
jgi:uncharacterized membrane protein YfbV (UPF0208 family)